MTGETLELAVVKPSQIVDLGHARCEAGAILLLPAASIRALVEQGAVEPLERKRGRT